MICPKCGWSIFVLASLLCGGLLVVESQGLHEQDSALPTTNRPFIGIQRVYPNLRFERPVYLTGAGDDSGRMFVVEQDGVIRVFRTVDQETESVKDSTVFLDIREQVSRRGNEEGLIGLAFHPNFKDNGQVFVHYSKKTDGGRRSVAPNIVSRFLVSNDDPNRLDPESEQVILQQRQPFSNHNGGMIEFGPDGYLYITFGDGGSRADPEGNGQKLDSLLGSIVRIDVDRHDADRNYAIPDDNPFVNVQGARPELWAIGLRNVWRFSFDRETGTLFAADVGQDKIEEVNIIEKGGNYGWNRFEANETFEPATELVHGAHMAPVAMYERSWGISITGGYVYRGTQFPEMNGKYLYGDYVSGNLWALSLNEDQQWESELVRRTGRSIASFGEDDSGELYLLSFDGGIYQVVATDEPEATFADWPARLSETGLYSSISNKTLSDEVHAYEVNAPFWSDGADKRRFIRLPEGESITWREQGTWQVPDGTVLIKNFDSTHLGRETTLETRLIKKTPEGWQAATYVWNLDGSDAELLPAGKQFELYQRGERAWNVLSWHAPSSSECASCHVDTAGFVLGLNTAQLNRSVAGENQIVKWRENGILKAAEQFDPATAVAFCDPFDESGSLAERARVYLDVNCAMCHQPNGPGNAKIDLRYTTALHATGMMDTLPAQGDFGQQDSRIIASGQPERSVLLQRMETLGAGRMPTIGSNELDKAGIELIRDWILGIQQ